MNNNGKFVISLDFELNWGVFDVFTIENYKNNLIGARKVIPMLLEKFDKQQIHATWGIVGFLYFSNKQDLLRTVPKELPMYKNVKLSSYSHMEHVGDNEEEDPYHFGLRLIDQIMKYPNQEIGTHTFSHYYCLAEGQNEAQFEVDLAHAVHIAEQYGISTHSIIFPRNQQNSTYLSVCEKYGLGAYRGNENHWIYNQTPKDGFLKRALRLLDSYINITGTHVYAVNELKNTSRLLNIPSSRFLRPYSETRKWLEPLKLRRIKREMTKAAREGKMYHLWWHPHNFGYPIKENMKMLDTIMMHFLKLKSQFGMESCNMHEVSQKVCNIDP